ncbi:MAG: site-specific integrase [Gemmataceae bacterium]|nr:site-specific integrase [Gemmataceae bacterium]
MLAARRTADNGRFRAHAAKPLADHLADWDADLRAKGNTPAHAALVAGRARRLAGDCGFARVADVTAAKVQQFVAGQWAAGRSVQTANFYLQAAKQFLRWLVRNRRVADNPLAHLTGGNVKTDRRHDRRELTPDEVAALLAAAEGGPVRAKLTGPDRAMLYRVALYTGFRASELASLTPGSFALDADPPAATVAAAYAKNRREDSVPLHPSLVPLLRDWLTGRPADRPLWPGRWAADKKAGVILKPDLAAARAAWAAANPDIPDADHLAYRDGAGRYADFHAQRHTFISGLVRSGVAPKSAQALARHSTITLTMDRYAHIGLTETAAAVGLLPAVAAPGCLRLHGVRATGGNRGPRVAVRRPKTDRRARAEND